MEKHIILSDGDKLKKIRKKYGLKQEEITGNEITRNLISEIETNKASITKKTAEIVIKNLTSLAKKRNFKVAETVDYLMENQATQATKILDNYIEELKTLSISKDDSFIKILKEAESFLIDWDIKDKKLNIYELTGDYYCNNNEMYQSAVYYEKALALLSRVFLDKKLLSILKKLSMVYGYIGNYNKSIECCNFALSRFDDISLKDKIILRQNNALAYKLTKNFEGALYNIEIAEKIVDKNDTSQYIKILNNKAICLCEMKLYKEALKLFNQILGLINENQIEEYLIDLINIANVYIDLNDKNKSTEYLNIITTQLPNLKDTSSYAADIYFDIGNIYKKFDKLNLTEAYYLKALDFSKKQKSYILATKILNNLTDMYIMEDNVEKMNNIREKVFFISIRQDKIDNLLMYKLIGFYDKIGNGKCKEIANFALKFQ